MHLLFPKFDSGRLCPSECRVALLASILRNSSYCLRTIAISTLTFSASSVGFVDDSAAQDTMPLETVVVVSPAVQDDGSLVLQAPTNAGSNYDSTNTSDHVAGSGSDSADTGLRVAKRPWLLEKLVGPEKDSSVKMDPPRPPVSNLDPPSLGRIEPPSLGGNDRLRGEDDRWISRRSSSRVHAKPASPSASVGDLNRPSTRQSTRQSARQSTRRRIQSPADTETPMPLTDVGIESTDTTPSLRPLRIENSKPLRSLDSTDNEAADSEPAAEFNNRQEFDQSETEVRIDDSDRQQSLGSAGPEADPSVEFDYAGFPKQPVKLTRSSYQMRSKMHRCLRAYYSDMEIASGRSNWGMMHAMMVYGIDTKVVVGRRSFSTIAWVAGNNVCRGQRLFEEDNGQLVVKSGVGLQGHDGQLLAVFSLCGVPASYPIYAGDYKFAVQDIIESEMLACKSGNELTFILIALAHYLDTDEQWLSADGESWDFERLIREELSQPVVGAACGGTHRLMGFGHALRQRRFEGKPIEGQWKRAEKFTEDFVQYVYRLQNRDGSFSTDWFEGREDNGDLDRKIQTTGHMVEWLLTVTPNAQLQNPRLLSAVRFLLNSMYEERDRDWSIGPKGHALRSLAMFYDRVYQSPPPWQDAGVAGRKKNNRRR
ncbi:hypothetical protein [Rubripirellula obstinata]|uniref:hypothetical protein n=1 Tax=Rubripirellula obstinata TaxID=406547 RepID=UPI00138FD682|nr:hypothetical protein [Rubripirellula obstinata]